MINFVEKISIVEFIINAFKNIDTSFEFRDWIYVKIMILLFLNEKQNLICLDIDCNVILTNIKFVVLHNFHYRIRQMITSLNVQDLNINKHKISKYIIVIIYFLNTIKRKFTKKIIRREIHLIKDFKVNMFIDNDIFKFENLFIDEANSKAIITNCNNLIISIKIKTLSKNMIKKALHAFSFTINFSHSITIIFIH